MVDCDEPGFLDDLPDLDLPDPPRRHVQKPQVDPVHTLMARVPPFTEAKYERFRAACERVYEYFRVPVVKEYWVKQLQEVAASAGETLVFGTGLQWPEDKAKFYAVMAVCAQRCTDIVLIPKQVREEDWYKSHECWVPEYVCRMDMAPQFIAYVEQDLGEQGLLDGRQPKGIPEERVSESANTGMPQSKSTPDAGQGSADNVSDKTPDDHHQWSLIALSKKEIGLALGLVDDRKIAQTLNALCGNCGIVLRPRAPHEKHPKAWFVALDTLKEPLLGRFDEYVRTYHGFKATH